MPASIASLSLKRTGPEAQESLRNLFQLYLRDMAEWFAVETNPDGTYAYDIASIWERGYGVYLARADDALAGFALAGPAVEWLGDVGAHDVREFFVIPGLRRSGVGMRIAALLWDSYPGPWLVRALQANTPSVRFWRAAIASYSCHSFHEEARMVKGRAWQFFRFQSHAA